jgi:hypothetical protein
VNHQNSTVEVTVILKLNQGVCTDVLHYHPCLNFLVLFLSREKAQKKKPRSGKNAEISDKTNVNSNPSAVAKK